MEKLENEIAKHKKKTSKTVKKTKHKHIYELCIFHNLKSDHYYKGCYCTVCGKIGTWGMDTKQEGESIRLLSQQELKEKYKDCKIKEVHNMFKTKYVEI